MTSFNIELEMIIDTYERAGNNVIKLKERLERINNNNE